MRFLYSLVLGLAIFSGGSFAQTFKSPPTLAMGATSAAACVVAAGALICWGQNTHGELGDGSNFDGLLPQTIIGTGVTQFSSGGHPGFDVAHSCAIVGTALRCWGDNSFHQLGDGTTDPSFLPKTIPLGTAVAPVAVAAGGQHTCVLFADKSVKCWGDNSLGQLGDGTDMDIDDPNGGDPLNWSAATAPFLKSGSAVIKTISQLRSGLGHSCALFGTVPKCWGANQFGQTGDPETVGGNTLGPVTVKSGYDDDSNLVPLTGVVTMKVGGDHTCATVTVGTTTGSLRCWGRNDMGQLGDNSMTDSPFPVVAMGSDVSIYELGGMHTCFVRFGALKCFGSNFAGQLGNGTLDDSGQPRLVKGGRFNVTAVSLGSDFSCGHFGATPVLKCWGSNQFGQVGDNVTDTDINPDYPNVLAPTNVDFVTPHPLRFR